MEERQALTPYILDFRYLLTDLTRYRDEDIRGVVQLRVALLLFKYIFRKELRERLPEILGLLDELASKRSGLEYLETVLRYISLGTDTLKPDELRQAVTQALTEVMKLCRLLPNSGFNKAFSQGFSKGSLKVRCWFSNVS